LAEAILVEDALPARWSSPRHLSRLDDMRSILASAVLLCLGVILVPFALLFVLYVPIVGLGMGLVSLWLIAYGAIGVVGGWSRR
jgi:hypothetical protein